MGEPGDGDIPEAHLLLMSEGGERRTYRLQRLPTIIGRSPESDVLVADPRVSRRHARITWRDRRFAIEDLGSTNGTLLNEATVTSAAPLSDGDVVSIGGVTLDFQVDAPTVVGSAPTGAGELRVNLSTHEVTVNGVDADLSPKEYLFLAALYRRAGGIASHKELASEVWPEFADGVPDDHVHQAATRLRRKLERRGQGRRYVLTVKGFGYRLATD